MALFLRRFTGRASPRRDAHQDLLQVVGTSVKLGGDIYKPAAVFFALRVGGRLLKLAESGRDSILYCPQCRFGRFHSGILAWLRWCIQGFAAREELGTRGRDTSRLSRSFSLQEMEGTLRFRCATAQFFLAGGNISRSREVYKTGVERVL